MVGWEAAIFDVPGKFCYPSARFLTINKIDMQL